MKEAKDLIRIRHVAYPDVPSCVLDPAAESNEDVHNHQDGEWGMS